MNRRAPSLPRLQPTALLVAPVAASLGLLVVLSAAKDGGVDLTIWLPVALFVAVPLALWFRPVRLAPLQRTAIAGIGWRIRREG